MFCLSNSLVALSESTISTCPYVHSNYNADSNMKSSNYSKIRFKPLINFELQESNCDWII